MTAQAKPIDLARTLLTEQRNAIVSHIRPDSSPHSKARAEAMIRRLDKIMSITGSLESEIGYYGPNGHGPAIEDVCRSLDYRCNPLFSVTY